MAAFFRVRMLDVRQAACTPEGTMVPEAGGRILEGDQAWEQMACWITVPTHLLSQSFPGSASAESP